MYIYILHLHLHIHLHIHLHLHIHVHVHVHVHIHIHIQIHIHTHSSRTMSSLFWACPNGVGDSLWRIQKILHLVNHAFLGTLRHLHWIDVFLQTLGIPISNSGLKNTNILEMLKSQSKITTTNLCMHFFPIPLANRWDLPPSSLCDAANHVKPLNCVFFLTWEKTVSL